MNDYKLEILSGVDYDVTFYWNDSMGMPINTSSFTAYMQIKENIDSTIIFFDASPYLITTGEDTTNGAVRLNIPAIATVSLPKLLKGVFDIKLKSATGNVYLLIDGVAIVKKTVTAI